MQAFVIPGWATASHSAQLALRNLCGVYVVSMCVACVWCMWCVYYCAMYVWCVCGICVVYVWCVGVCMCGV